jgi:moderate conductance mechanosensitive channel
MSAVLSRCRGASDRNAKDGPLIVSGTANGRVGTCTRVACTLGAVLLLWWVGSAVPCRAQAITAPDQAHSPRAEAVPSREQTPADFLSSTNSRRLADAAATLIRDLQPIVAAAPRLPDELEIFVERVADPAEGPFVSWLLQLIATFVLASAALALVPRLLSGARRSLVATPAQSVRLAGIVVLLGIDALGVIALASVAFVARILWFGGQSIRDELAVPLIAALVYWRLLLLAVNLVLQPDAAPARLADLPDARATRLYQATAWLVGLQVFSLAALRALLDGGLPFACVQSLAILVGVADALIALAFIRRERRAQKSAFGPETLAGDHRPTHRLLVRSWQPAAVLFIVLALLTWLFGVIFRDLAFFWGVVETGGIVLGVWVLETIFAVSLHRAPQLRAGDHGTVVGAGHWWSGMVCRCLAVGIWLVAAAVVARLWLVARFHILSAEQWDRYSGSAVGVAATFFVAYVLCQAVLTHTEHRLLSSSPASNTTQQTNAPPPIASRLQTILPLLRFFILAAIGTAAVLVALSALGINTTSLIAGASIFGLAISFGSQSLVRDIVSGIFFMADDAFRIGEYIDCGKLKGTVEGMSIRSLRLRHQNGPVHVIPFGHIEQMTNYSRDWATTKFNLQLAPGTDLEKVRKTAKQIGLEMMNDPELAPEIIQPLKLQGITEIGPSAVLVRFKFTARPAQPTFVYRKALALIYQQFHETGIKFANNSVVVQTTPSATPAEPMVEMAAAGGAATQAVLPTAAE